MKKRIKNEKGLTLIELLAVIVILAIIAAIAIPAIGNIINNSKDKATISEALNIVAGAKLAKIEGLCGESDNACTEETEGIGDYIEGVTEGAEFSASYDGTKWSVTFSELANIKNTDRFEIDSEGPHDEAVLKAAVEK